MEISNFKLEAREFNKIERILSSLCSKSNVDAVFLINRNGQKIAHQGDSDVDLQALSSLAASNLAATFGLARILGEKEFRRAYLRGDNFSLLLLPAGEHALLLSIIQLKNEKNVNLKDLRQAVLVLADVLDKCTQRIKVSEEF